MYPEIIIASRPQAERLLMSRKPGLAIRHMISIGAPGNPPPDAFELCAMRLRLEFFDVSHDTGHEYGPQAWQVEQVIEFARNIQNKGGRLLVHCEYGRSRSAAAALTVLATWLGAGKEQEAVDRVYALRPEAWPNRLFVALADELLGRDGVLRAAVNTAIEKLRASARLASCLSDASR
jgi:predicted protein tyrosine phosphatase